MDRRGSRDRDSRLKRFAAPEVTVYAAQACSFCAAATRLLDERRIPYREINLSLDPEGRQRLVARTGLMTFPQILVDGETLGGYDQLRAAADAGRLDVLGARAA